MTRRATLAGAILAIGGGVALALAIWVVQRATPGNPEHVVAATFLLCVVAGFLMVAGYLAVRRRAATPAETCLAILAAAGVSLVGMYFFWAGPAVFQPADILIWSESPFVNDIIKFRIGMPLYTTPADFDSFYYTPGSQLLTYALATAFGAPTSIPMYRVIQLGYLAIASLLIADATRRVSLLAGVTRPGESPVVWGVFIAASAFLLAGNTITNPFTHLLHNDALALLVCAAAFDGLAAYAGSRQRSWLVFLALIPAAGFLVKQSLAAWAFLIVAYLVAFDRPRNWSRAVTFGAAALGAVGGVYLMGRVLWGDPFHYWVVTGLGNHPVSPMRALDHGLAAWAYFASGFAAAVVTFHPRIDSRLFGLWCVWLALFASQTYTSGIAWMLNHMGPGSVLVMPWLGLLLLKIWPAAGDATWRAPSSWLRPASLVAIVILLWQGLGVVRSPLPSVPADLNRYVSAIETEVRSEDLSRVLIDHGSWMYLPGGIVMKDRMAAIGEAGYTETGDFSAILDRIRSHHYSRILVHDFHGEDFQYDHFSWRKSSGIREGLKASYSEVRTIPGVDGMKGPWFKTISVLEPKVTEKTEDVNRAAK